MTSCFATTRAAWLARWCASILLIAFSTAEARNVTGRHTEEIACSAKNKADNLGLAYQENCFRGSKTIGATTEYVLVQNGNDVCGHYSSCGGFNCGKVFTGEVVGRLQGDELTLFHGDGHVEQGFASVETFKVSEAGTLSVPGPPQIALLKHRDRLADPAAIAQCTPRYQTPPRLINYAMEVQGSRPSSIKFRTVARPALRATQTRVVLSRATSSFTLEDGYRPDNNLVPREVLIVNRSAQPWEVSVSRADFIACTEFLAQRKPLRARTTAKTYFQNAYDDSLSVPAGSKLGTWLCPGDALELNPMHQ